MRTYGWKSQAELGTWGQGVVSAYLTAHGYLVEDVTGNRDYQRQDIDFLVKAQRKQAWRTVEVKTDAYTSGNLFLELVTDKGLPGCVFKSRAEIWCYWLCELGQLLFIELPKLQLWLVEHSHEYERTQVGSRRGKGRWSIEGICVPITHLRLAGVASKVTLEKDDVPDGRTEGDSGEEHTAAA